MALFDSDELRRQRCHFIAFTFVVSVIATPPDIVSQFALAVPMLLLYEAVILAAKLGRGAAERS